MKKGMVKALNRQIMDELDTSYLYLQMADWFEKNRLGGFASWLRRHAHEEVGRALLLFNHLRERSDEVTLGRVDAIRHRFTSASDVITQLVERGKSIAAGINGLLDMAGSEDDSETQLLLTWFASVQLQEEVAMVEVLERVTAVCRDSGSLLELDRELSGTEYRQLETRRHVEFGGNNFS